MLLHGNESAADYLLKHFGPKLRVMTPLGLGKPNRLLNALYRRVKSDPTLGLTIFTALSLTPPNPRGDLAIRFFGPFAKRQWGDNYPVLDYAVAAARDELPENVRVHEFYTAAGAGLNSVSLQRDYQSINYTHVVARLVDERPTLLLQLVARSADGRFSLSCNPDLSRDVVDVFKARGLPLTVVGVVHPDLPFLKGDAEVPVEYFGTIVEDDEPPHQLFAVPRSPVDAAEHAIGFHASRLAVDDGTLQLGIGSLSDALTAALICRHQKNGVYLELLGPVAEEAGIFQTGLHGLSEMVMDNFMHLRRAGILKRKTPDGHYLTGGFVLGSSEFYEWLRSLKGEDFDGLYMGRISQINHLMDLEPRSRRGERKNARLYNTCMQVTVLGGAASETLADGRVVSGVGGQYNFVAMAHELPDARSILMLRSTRTSGGKRSSNVVYSHGHLTIPRHLRDIIVTEYGVADVRGRTDEQTILTILAITDAEFQGELLAEAKRNKKVGPSIQLPARAAENTPEKLAGWIAQGRAKGLFQRYPFGSDFTPEEEKLADALERLKANPSQPYWLMKSLKSDPQRFRSELKRMNLDSPKTLKEILTQRALIAALTEGA